MSFQTGLCYAPIPDRWVLCRRTLLAPPQSLHPPCLSRSPISLLPSSLTRKTLTIPGRGRWVRLISPLLWSLKSAWRARNFPPWKWISMCHRTCPHCTHGTEYLGSIIWIPSTSRRNSLPWSGLQAEWCLGYCPFPSSCGSPRLSWRSFPVLTAAWLDCFWKTRQLNF